MEGTGTNEVNDRLNDKRSIATGCNCTIGVLKLLQSKLIRSKPQQSSSQQSEGQAVSSTIVSQQS